jgi:hypothetical protein
MDWLEGHEQKTHSSGRGTNMYGVEQHWGAAIVPSATPWRLVLES